MGLCSTQRAELCMFALSKEALNPLLSRLVRKIGASGNAKSHAGSRFDADFPFIQCGKGTPTASTPRIGT